MAPPIIPVSFFYPASGYRGSLSGNLLYVGANGYAWSNSPASASSANGSYLRFDSSSMNPEYYDRRAVGFPVRCVQE